MKGQKFIPLVVVVAGLLAYHNSFTGEFVRDDGASILENPTIRHLWPIWEPLSPPHRESWLTVEGRPLINLSLAINYALGGYNVWGYHALNLTVHILAGLTLLGIVRRTLLAPILASRFGAAADELALATAVLWTVHPLQTESVTYMIQRAESIMGLFYLLTLYCLIRGVESVRPRLWYGLSVTACALGMASKEVMASAPLMVLLYDRAFLSGSFREAWQRRRLLYGALASTWILWGFLFISAGIPAQASTTAQRYGLTWWQRLATQPEVILYYLRLSVWPSPLCLNHPWPIVNTWTSILPSAVAVVILLGATVWAWKRSPAPLGAGSASFGTRQALGFVGAWFFLILAPSSSFIPLHELVVEHRMYLSLAAVVSLVVMGLYSLVGRQSLAVFMVMAIGLGYLTWRRNQDYRNEVTLWADTVAKFPNDALQHYNLGIVLDHAGRHQEAIGQYEIVLRLRPGLEEAHYNLGLALERTGRAREAMAQYELALLLKPDNADAHNNLGVLLAESGRSLEARAHFELALRFKPDYAEAHNNLGIILTDLGKLPEAIEHYEEALRFKPDFAEAHHDLGVALARLGKLPEAIAQFEQALRLKPDHAEAHKNLGNALRQTGKVPEAIQQYEQALKIAPDMVEAHYDLGVALEQIGQNNEAIRHYEQALLLKPDYLEAQNSLARLRAAR